MKRIFKSMMCFVLSILMLTGSSVIAFASNQEIQGSTDSSQAVEVTANIKSMYSVSLPASIDLAYEVLADIYIGEADEITTEAEGYFGKIIFGCAGKISSNEYVFITPSFPCTMTSTSSDATVALQKILPSTKAEPKTQWNSTEIGTCSFDGVTLTNCQYAYNDGLQIGFLLSQLTAYESYKGNLTFNFGVRSN